MIVVDTNVLAYLFIDGDRTETVRQVFARDPEWRAPPLWRAEFLNVLAISHRAGVLDTAQAFEAWQAASSLMLGREVEPGGDQVLHGALESGLSAYDAQFVVVAELLEVPLVTADRRILNACPATAISIEGFAAQ